MDQRRCCQGIPKLMIDRGLRLRWTANQGRTSHCWWLLYLGSGLIPSLVWLALEAQVSRQVQVLGL